MVEGGGSEDRAGTPGRFNIAVTSRLSADEISNAYNLNKLLLVYHHDIAPA